MTSVLMQLRDTLNTYVVMAAQLFDLDVDINDENITRVAATGRFNRNVGMSIISEGNVTKHVIETGKVHYVSDPCSDPICNNCANLINCHELSELCCPITLYDRVIGTITVASSNEQQKKQLHNSYNKLLPFLESIAELISMKAMEYQFAREQQFSLNLQYQLMNLIDECVMIISPQQEIMYCNLKAEKVLGYKLAQLRYHKKHGQFSVRRMARRDEYSDEYLIRIRTKLIKLTGKSYPVPDIDKQESNSVYIFSEIQRSQNVDGMIGYAAPPVLSSLIAESAIMKETLRKCDAFAYDNNPVLLTGESGTGKYILAQAIHNQGARKNRRFLDGASFLGEINGIAAGAVATAREGWLQSVNGVLQGDTICVTELCNLNLKDQDILQSIIQNSALLDTKVICISSLNLMNHVRSGALRSDLYFALDVFHIHVPALRVRGKQDIRRFIDCYLSVYNSQIDKRLTFSHEIYQAFYDYILPGNIREIDNLVSYIVVSAEEDTAVLNLHDLPLAIRRKLTARQDSVYNLEVLERDTILSALNEFGSGHSKYEVAKALGISLATLYRKLKKYQIGNTIIFE